MLLLSRSPSDDGRLTRVTPDDHAAWIWIPTLLAFCYSFCFLGFRAIVKLRKYAADDAVLGTAYIAALVHWITTLEALHFGLGKATHLLTASEEKSASLTTFAGRILLLVALCLSKCCVLLLIRSIFGRDMKPAWRACNISLTVLAGWAILVVLISSAGCSPRSVLAVDADLTCPHQAARWKVIIALDVFTEVAIILLISALVLPLQMKWKGKFYVIIAFASRLPNIAFSIAFLSTYLSHLNRTASPHTHPGADTDPSLSIAIPTAWFESMLAYSLMSATIPCLQNGMKRFRTGGLAFAWD